MAREVRWEIRLCGRVAATSSEGRAAALPGRQGQLLLAYLVCHRTRACPRYELEDVLEQAKKKRIAGIAADPPSASALTLRRAAQCLMP